MPLGIDRRRAALTGRRDRLPVDVVGAVARYVDTGHVGFLPALGQDVAGIIHVDDALEKLRVGYVPDRDEQPGAVDRAFLVGLIVAHLHAGHLFLFDVHHLDDLRMPDRLDFVVGQRPLGHDLGRPQFVAPVHEIDFGGEPGEIRGLLTGGVAAADHHERLVAKHRQGAVTGGAVGDPFFLELGLAFQSEMPVAGAAGDNHRLRLDLLAVDREFERLAAEIDRLNRAAKLDLRPETLGLLLHLHHQLRAVDALRESGEILNDTRRGEQPARHGAGEHQRLEVGAGGVNCGSQSGTARPNNDYFFHKND